MKKQIIEGFRSLGKPAQTLAPHWFRPVRIVKRDPALILIPGLLWLISLQSRSLLIKPSCLGASNACQKKSVFFLDQLSLGLDIDPADWYSFCTQNFSVFLALTLPMLWSLYLVLTKKHWNLRSMRQIGADFFLAIQAIFWNGFFTETSHWLSQRPRPFVYSDPQVLGVDPAHYTSFYSGHTSATAAANTIALLLLISRRAPAWLLLLDLAVTETLIFSTAFFRMMSARHFLTDVLCGAVAGIFTALFVFGLHPKEESPHFAD